MIPPAGRRGQGTPLEYGGSPLWNLWMNVDSDDGSSKAIQSGVHPHTKERPDNTGSCFGHDSRRLRRYHTEVVGASVAPHSAPRKDGTMGWQRIRGHDAL